MNVFSNIGITELVIILLLALLVVGPERLPELGRKLGQILRDVRRAYENLASDLGPELAELQKSTQELRESVESVRSIPQDVVKTVVQAADLDETVADLKEVSGTFEDVGKTLSTAGQTVKNPVGAAIDAARTTLDPRQARETAVTDQEPAAEETAAGDSGAGGSEVVDTSLTDGDAEEAAASEPEAEAIPLAEIVEEQAPATEEHQTEAAADE